MLKKKRKLLVVDVIFSLNSSWLVVFEDHPYLIIKTF